MRVATKEEVLRALEVLGKDLARDADPSTYSYERRDLARHHQRPLTATRDAYRRIRTGSDNGLSVLIRLRQAIPTGIERNMLERIIDMAQGTLADNHPSWRHTEKRP